MRNLLMKVSYDGTDYNGFQTQPGGHTIQDYLEEAIRRLSGEELKITASGRTDAGVHARMQIFNFYTASPIPLQRWCMALNTWLPPDIVVSDVMEVPMEFHSRHAAKRKTYRYTINANQFPDLFNRRYQFHHHGKLDIPAMEQGLSHLIGTHDYTSFASRKSTKTSHVRTIFEARMETDTSMCRPNPRDQGIVHTYLTGNGFLQHMVRIIMGTLLEVGEGKRHPDQMKMILEAKNRAAAGPTAMSTGLMLWDLEYDIDGNTQPDLV
ncbi:tRNA pseudouridine(38-40) synthase TruA [Paenibacillus sp. JCM 10914]|uniref:tRNA pseudouridine(38-40) synthase TruA n=1 Tax=Paenibacillus sp. JCM 10914 TaxID=1236974 RepID=UPI0003CCB533|nr:tRNA pseudouridine(38-40) synthase TruA [Paenibacillus sp. JCM 10914]GAE08867.1 tRNA pseudouridine synthase A [Paenibacillus sp. JCM 10914]